MLRATEPRQPKSRILMHNHDRLNLAAAGGFLVLAFIIGGIAWVVCS